jgi:Protein of unknown function (DUF3574)
MANRKIAAILISGVIFCTLHACAQEDELEPCSIGQISRIYLGQSTPSGGVTEAEWQQFIDEAVTPRFPHGFTVLPGEGHWRNAFGVSQREATRVLEIAHDHNPSSRDRVHQLANEYKRRFTQHSVLVTQVPSYQCS